VLLLARSDAPLAGEARPEPLEAAALVLFDERIRPDAADTIRFFEDQGVTCKVVSGDGPRTVGTIAVRVGIPGAEHPVDGSDLPEALDALGAVLETTSVIGRVTPHQKRSIVDALQQRGHVVAMTGDGVNDALALKEADIGIAMGNGAPATRAVAQLVLLDGEFASLPGVVAEGRRVIANVERVANLFVTKTVYALLFAVAVGVTRWPYPFLPRQLTLVSSVTIGIPAFFLALGPSSRRYVPGFVDRVLRFAGRAGIVAGTATFVVYAFGMEMSGVSLDQARTAATIVLLGAGLWVLSLLARPFTPLRITVVAAMVVCAVGALAIPGVRHFFALELPPASMRVVIAVAIVAAGVVLEIGLRLTLRPD
jgi:cation-transporting P-type ATPase E